MKTQTIADVMDVPMASLTSKLPFIGANDPDLKKEWYLITRSGTEMSILYICPRTGSFLCSKRLSQRNDINPLEYNKNGKFKGFSSSFDIVGKKRVNTLL